MGVKGPPHLVTVALCPWRMSSNRGPLPLLLLSLMIILILPAAVDNDAIGVVNKRQHDVELTAFCSSKQLQQFAFYTQLCGCC